MQTTANRSPSQDSTLAAPRVAEGRILPEIDTGGPPKARSRTIPEFNTRAGQYVTTITAAALGRPRFGRVPRPGNTSARAARRALARQAPRAETRATEQRARLS